MIHYYLNFTSIFIPHNSDVHAIDISAKLEATHLSQCQTKVMCVYNAHCKNWNLTLFLLLKSDV